MYSVTCRFADLNVKINFLYKSFYDFCAEYIVDSEPQFEIEVTQSDIEFERQNGDNSHIYSDGYLQTLAIYRKFCHFAIDYGAVLFHGSAVAVDGKGYIFTAPSGTGKSTHAALWRKLYPESVKTVNDDKPLIRIKDGEYYVYGTPWDGKHRLSANICVPLRGICRINRALENKIRRLSVTEALPTILSQTHVPNDTQKGKMALNIVLLLAKQVPIWNLECDISDAAARLSFGAMTGKNIE